MAQPEETSQGMKAVILSAIAGVIALILLLISSWSFFGALFWGLVVAGVVYLICCYGFGWCLCLGAKAPDAGHGAVAPAGDTSSAAPVSAASSSAAASGFVAGADTAQEAGSADETTDIAGVDTGGAESVEAPAEPASDEVEDSVATDAATEEPTATETKATGVVPSKALSGEADLASRKGTWRYEGGDTSEEAAAPEPEAKPAPAPEADPAPKTSEADAGEGTKPEFMTEAREGGPDDLKQIKGVGPKLESLLHELGVFHFDQIAGWGAPEVAWMDSNLAGFKGRVTRDDWVEQAKILAAGGATEFSKKVDKGGVY